jgi:hypothetical protein
MYGFSELHNAVMESVSVVVRKVKSFTSVQYVIQLNAHVTVSICYFVRFLLHFSARIGRL